jgi:chemotaxis protein methyltransferase CheR
MSKPYLPLSSADLQLLCDFLYGRTGLIFGENKRPYIERRLTQRMEQQRIDNFSRYMVLLRTSGEEVEELINSFTVNETYFYRELHQLRCLSRSILPEIVAKRQPGDLVRIWSAPCSTGEEPYSIAIWLLENWPLVDAYNIDILGSDIDTRVLKEAIKGIYGERSVSHLPPELTDRYFEAKLNQRQIIGDLRESVKFTQVNILDAAATERQGRFDVIFCRNVLIYFDDGSRLTAVRNLFRSLNPGGFICLGHSESMARISDAFTVRRFEDAIVYQRPGA